MIKLINKFYMSKPALLVSYVGAILSWILWAVFAFMNGEIKLACFSLIFGVITASLFITYLKGETSIQKLLFGSLFIFLIVDMLEILFVYVGLVDVLGIEYVIMISIILGLEVLLFICHILQQSDHVGSSISTVIGQILGFIMVAWVVFLIIMTVKGFVTDTDISFGLACIFTSFMLICMETRIKAYKQIRFENINNNTWNEETRQEAKKLFKL